jgi:hypothetical protein
MKIILWAVVPLGLTACDASPLTDAQRDAEIRQGTIEHCLYLKEKYHMRASIEACIAVTDVEDDFNSDVADAQELD